MKPGGLLAATLLALFSLCGEGRSAPAAAPVSGTGPNCGVEGGQNLGVIIQTCAPETALVSAPDAAKAEPVQQSDGTYLHEFVYRAPVGKRFSMRLCGAEVVDFQLVGLKPLTEISFEGTEGRHCTTKDYLAKASPISLLVQTRTTKLKFAIQTSIVQSVVSGRASIAASQQSALVAATIETAPIPIVIPVVMPPIVPPNLSPVQPPAVSVPPRL